MPASQTFDAPHRGLVETRTWTGEVPARGDAPALEWIEAAPAGPTIGAPLLFVHGAFAGAWMWNEVMLPFFARRGRRAVAVSLRGHGASGGREGLRRIPLSHFVEDVRRAVAHLGEPPVLVGHSLGGLIAQRLIGHADLRGLVLVCSLPPEGLMWVGPRIAVTDPAIWSEAFVGSLARARPLVVSSAQKLLFSDRLPPDRIHAYAARMTPESARALAEAHLPQPVMSALLHRLPTLVVGAGMDRLVSRASVLRTALYHGAESLIAEDMGHFLPVDIGADDVARRMADWLDRQDL